MEAPLVEQNHYGEGFNFGFGLSAVLDVTARDSLGFGLSRVQRARFLWPRWRQP